MAAILKLRRGTSFTSLQESELFYDTVLGTIHLGDGGGSNTTYKTLVKLNESNSGSLHLFGNITGSHISASGDIYASSIQTTGDATIGGNIVLAGNIFLGDGDSSSDNVSINSSFSGSFLPTTDSVFTLGSVSKKYLDLRVVNATIDNINLPGSGILSSSVTDFTDYSQSVDNRLDIEEAKSVILQTVTSSLDNRLDIEEAKSTTLTALTASYDNRLSNLQIISASHDDRLDNIQLTTQSLDNRVNQLETDTGSQDQRLDRIELETSSLDNRLDVEEAKSVILQTVTSSLDGRLDVEESKSLTLTALTASYDIRLSNLQITSASHDGRLDIQEAKSTTLATVTSSLDQRADRLEAYTSSFASDTVTLTNKTINGSNNTLTVDISRDTNLAVSDTTEVNMILTDDTISAELIGGVVSGSSQVNADTVTNFDSNVKAKLTAETVVSGSAQVIDFVTAGDLDMSGNKVLFGNVYNTEGDLPTASSYHGMFAHVHGTTKGYYAHGGNWIKLIDESSSDTNDLTEGSSNLYYTDTRVKVKLNAETVVSGSSQITLGGDVTGTADDVNVGSVQGISLTSGEVTQIAAIGSTTISATQWGYLGATNQGLSTSDNVTFADGDFTGDVQVTGNLTVLGAATEISSTELRIEDKLITVASGSADSAASDGAGIEIDGAGVSLQWDHNTTSFVLNAKVSSSVGFKGEGGELTGIDTAQVTEGSNLYYTDTRVKTKLDAETVVSGSSQINADTITNFDSNVKTKLDDETVVSGSSQINYSSLSGINNNIISSSSDTSQVDMIINGGSISANLKGGVVSGSSQINSDQTTGWVADVRKQIDNVGLISGSVQVNANTITNFDSNVKTKLDVDSVHSGSFLGTASTTNLSEGSNKYYTDARVKTKLDAENVISSSIQVLGGTNIVSGSSQIDHDATTNFVANEHIDHSSITLGSGLGLSGGGTIDTNRSISLDTASSHFTTGIKTKLDAETVVSGSAQVDYDSISNQPTTITSDQSSKIAANHLKVGYTDALVKTKLNSETVVSGSTFSSPSQGTVRATINGASTNVDTGLQTGDSPTFNTLTLSSVAAGGSTDFDAVFDVSGLLKKRTIGTAAFLNVSASIADDPNSIPTTKAVNDALIEAGAGDITAVNSTSTISPALTGLIHTEQGTESGGAYGNVGNVVLAVATGSAHFINAVQGISPSLPSGVVSGSSQVTKTKGDVGLGNVDNESKSTMFSSPTFTGVPISTTPADNDNSTKIATTAFVMREVSDLLGGAPAAFDTLLEISSSIANGDSDVVSLTTTVGGKLQKDQNLSDLTNASTARTNLGIAGGSSGTFLKHDGTFGTPSYIANTNTQLSTADVRGKFTAGTNITISSGEISSTDTNTQLSTSDVRGKISASGNSQYNSSTGVITSTDTNTQNTAGQIRTKIGSGNNGHVPTAGTSGHFLKHDGTFGLPSYTTNSNLSQEQVEDFVGGMLGGTETGITVTYQDGTGDIDFVVTSQTDENFTTADHNKLDGIEIGADITDAANVLTSLPDGVVSGSAQVSYNSIQNRPTIITSDQASKIAANHLKVGYTDALVKTKLDADSVVSGSISDIKTFLSISASDISDVDAFSQSGNYSGLRAQSTTKGDVGLGNVANESKATMFASPSLSGNPTAPTQADNDNSTKIATTAFVMREVGDLLGGAPEALDTLLEISASIANGDSDVVSLTSVVGTKLAKASNLSDLANASTARTNLGVAIGSDVQEYSAQTAFLTGTQTFTGAKSFGSAVNIDATTASTTKTTGALIVDGGVGIAGAVNVGGDVVAFSSSDRELKNNILPIPWALEKINRIGGYSFDWNEDKQDIYKGKDIGVIAQEIEEVLPELVVTRENGYKAVKYDKLVSLLIEGIKDLSKEVEELKNKIDN